MHSQDHSSSAPKSSARLAAEAAFSLLDDFGPQPNLGPVPVVTTVNRKLVVPPTGHPIAGAESTLDAMPSEDPQVEESKHPRVFLVQSAFARGVASDLLPLPGRISESTTGHSRRRRNASAPVKVIYTAPWAVPGGTAARASAEASVLPSGLDPSVARLAAELAALDSTFTAIRAAMAFEVADGRSTAEWVQLSKAADRISIEIEMWMAAPLR